MAETSHGADHPNRRLLIEAEYGLKAPNTLKDGPSGPKTS